MLVINAQSLRSKISEFELLIEDEMYSIVAVSEHWLKEEEVVRLNFSNFSIKSTFSRKTSSHGGSMLLTRKNLTTLELSNLVALSVEHHCEISAVEAISLNAIFINIYRPPSGDFNMFMEIMDVMLDNINFLNNYVILSGDFNILFNSDCSQKTHLCNLFCEYGLEPLVKFPTRGSNCIDNVFTNSNITTCHVESTNTLLSDHLGIVLKTSLPSSLNNCNTVKKLDQ